MKPSLSGASAHFAASRETPSVPAKRVDMNPMFLAFPLFFIIDIIACYQEEIKKNLTPQSTQRMTDLSRKAVEHRDFHSLYRNQYGETPRSSADSQAVLAKGRYCLRLYQKYKLKIQNLFFLVSLV